MPYLGRMLIRAAALSLSLAACGFASDPSSAVSERTAEVEQAIIDPCATEDSPCDPFDRDASAICEPSGDPMRPTRCAPGVPAVSPR